MLKRVIVCFVVLVFAVMGLIAASAATGSYGWLFCNMSGYKCVKIKRGDSWESLFRDDQKRDIVMRLNRINLPLYPGMMIAVPEDMDNYDYMSFSPMPEYVTTNGRREIIVDLDKQAFGAYLENGRLVHWGPVSGGRGWCPDSGACNTPRGVFYIYSRGSPYCVSTIFPIPEGGAPMPYCMFFYKGFALHGSELPGYNASHGCIRLFVEDAKWLNLYFVDSGRGGTKVIVH